MRSGRPYWRHHSRARGTRISDEHRRKLLRIAHQLKTPFIYTERRLLERIGTFAAPTGYGTVRIAAPARVPGR